MYKYAIKVKLYIIIRFQMDSDVLIKLMTILEVLTY